MPKETGIEWTEHTWNAFSGCLKVSPGCDNCYAETIANGRWGSPAFPNGFDLTLRPHKVRDPMKWKTPSRIFVNSMSDLFLGTVPTDYLVNIWDTMLEADWHQYQILTKRPIPAARLIEDLDLDLPPFTLCDFDAYADPYASFRSFWQNADKASTVCLLFTDAQRGNIFLNGRFTHPDGSKVQIDTGIRNEKRRIYNFYFRKTVLPWFNAYIAPYQAKKTPFYHRNYNMLYWGAVVEL